MPEKVRFFFDPDSHSYFDETGQFYTSVTTLIGKAKKPFDTEYWTVYKALEARNYTIKYSNENLEKRQFNFLGITSTIDDIYSSFPDIAEEANSIGEGWKADTLIACKVGSDKHDYLEAQLLNIFNKARGVIDSARIRPFGLDDVVANYKDSDTVIDSIEKLYKSDLIKTHPEISKLLKKYIEAGFVLIPEIRVYLKEYLLAGTIDVLAVNPITLECYIIDWKTNKDKLKFTSGYYRKEKKIINGKRVKVKTDEWVPKEEYFLPPIDNMPLCKGNEYVIQTNIYGGMSEEWGLKCKGIIIVHIQRNAETNKFFDPVFYSVKYNPSIFYRMSNFNLSLVN